MLEVGTVAALGTHNLAINYVAAPLDDVLNVLGAIGLTVGARLNGLGWQELGMDPRALRRGATLGVGAGVSTAALIVSAASIPAVRRFFHDQRVMVVGPREAFYHAALRIPLATALTEEVLFRGVLEAALTRRRSPLAAGIWSSLLFGLWHVLPTLRTFQGHPINKLSGGGRFRAVAGAVLATALAGAGFRRLRRSSGSLVAPVLVHAAVNVSAYLVGRSVVRRSGARGDSPG
jgi:membrane protease YdiL (CAAX protease family)